MVIYALVRTHDQDRAVGVADHRIRHAPHQGPSQAAQAAAPHHDQPRTDLFAHANDLPIPMPSRSEVCLRDGPSGPLDLLYLPVEHLSGLPLHRPARFVEQPAGLRYFEVGGVILAGNADDVQLGFGAVGQVYGRLQG